MNQAEIAGYIAAHHMQLIIAAMLAFGIIAAQVRGNSSKRAIAHLKDRNERLLRIMERISGVRADDV